MQTYSSEEVFFIQNNPDLGPFLWQPENIEIIFKNQHIRYSTLNLGIEKKCREKNGKFKCEKT